MSLVTLYTTRTRALTFENFWLFVNMSARALPFTVENSGKFSDFFSDILQHPDFAVDSQRF